MKPLTVVALAAICGGIGGIAVSLPWPWPSPTEVAQCPWPNCSDHGKRRRTPYETTRRKSSCCIKTRDGVMCWTCADYDELSQDQIISRVKYGHDSLKPDETQ
jgi:hypothetical protein